MQAYNIYMPPPPRPEGDDGVAGGSLGTEVCLEGRRGLLH